MIADIRVTEKSFGPKALYTGVVFSVDDREKVGVIGRNGVGKSTLFGILAGTDTDYTGEIIYKRGVSVVATAQEHGDVAADTTVLQYILAGLPEYSELSHVMETYPTTMGDDMRMIETYTTALQRFDDKGFYRIEELVERELDTFQLVGIAHRPFVTLSGGQKRLVEVVKVMHADADLALLDEPTNHMDYVAKNQFVDWLAEAREAMLIITHDRDVLKHVDRIIEIKDGKSVSFKGNYDAYLKQNAVTTGTAMNDFAMVEKRIENLKTKVLDYQRLKEKARNPATIQKFKRLENVSRKELAELQALEKPTFWIDKASVENLNYKVGAQYDKFKAKNIRVNVRTSESRSSRVLIKAENVSLGYSAPLFSGVKIDLREGEAAELRGRNGAGKTTLIKALLNGVSGPDDRSAPKIFPDKQKTILGAAPPVATRATAITIYAGTLELDPSVRVGLYEQETPTQYADLPLGEAIERMHLDRDLAITPTKVRQLMSDYLFNEGDGLVPLSRLSGGQKARFQLIAMLAGDPGLLVLDEPTNHLDLPSIEELENALQRYAGAILYVSHDSYFRDAIGGETIIVGADQSL